MERDPKIMLSPQRCSGSGWGWGAQRHPEKVPNVEVAGFRSAGVNEDLGQPRDLVADRGRPVTVETRAQGSLTSAIPRPPTRLRVRVGGRKVCSLV
jgi:hypothetical protein